jgi:integrase
MQEKQVTVWVQRFSDRQHLMLQWTDPDTGRRKSKSAGTSDPDQAEKARADHEYELNHGLYQEASRMTWERFRELFEAEFVAARRANTRHNYAATLDSFERLAAPRTVRSITERTVSAFAAALRKEPGRRAGETMAASTIKIRMQFLRTALRWAASQKLIPAAPRFPGVKVPKRRPQPVPAEAFEMMLARTDDRHLRAFLLCGWLAGLRLAEAIALEWEETDKAPWLDLAADRIRFPAGMVKADEDQWVPLDAELRQVLAALPRHGRRVFHFTRGGISKRIEKLAKRAGVRLHMRALRRGFGCRYAGKVSAHVLQRLMRHSNIAITMTYYANVDDAVMDAVLGSRNSPRNRNAPAAESDSAAEAQSFDSEEVSD